MAVRPFKQNPRGCGAAAVATAPKKHNGRLPLFGNSLGSIEACRLVTRAKMLGSPPMIVRSVLLIAGFAYEVFARSICIISGVTMRSVSFLILSRLAGSLGSRISGLIWHGRSRFSIRRRGRCATTTVYRICIDWSRVAQAFIDEPHPFRTDNYI